MSAISGLIQKPLPRDAHDVVQRMCAIQRHRNPAGYRVVQNEIACFGSPVISIAAEQIGPIEKASGQKLTFLIANDSAIYNFDILRRDLEAKGIVFRTDTDEELLLNLYKVYGHDCPSHLRGDFAFAIWDAQRQNLFLARDRFGIRPLFYCWINSTFLFASELKALIKSGRVDRSIDLDAIYHYLFFTFFRQPQTPLKNIRSLLPAHTLSFNLRDGNIKLHQYWDIPYSANKSQDEIFLIQEGRAVLEEAIAVRARKARSIGVSLSGGLDSSTVAAMVAKLGYPLKTYTFGFKNEGEDLNEFHYSSLVAQKIGSIHSEVVMSSHDILSNLPQMVWHFDTPSAGIILSYCLAKTANQAGVDVTFRGDGAHSAFEAPAERMFNVIHEILSPLNLLPSTVKQNVLNGFEKFFTPFESGARGKSSNFSALIRLLSGYFQTATGRKNLDLMFSENERKDFFATPFWKSDPDFKETCKLVLDVMNKAPSSNILEKMLYEEYHRFSDQALGHITGVNGAFGIDGVQPYLDHKVVEFSQNCMPLSFRTISLPNKYILHKIAESLLPLENLQRSQRGFAMPFHSWLRGDLKALVNDVFSEATIRKRGIFEFAPMKSLYDNYYQKKRPYMSWRKLWVFTVLEIWFRIYMDPADIEKPQCSDSIIIS